MRFGVVLAGLLGAALAIGLIAWFGFGPILSAVAAIGWPGFGIFTLWQMATFILLGLGWFVVAPGEPPRRLASFVWARQVREGAADCLPFSPIGGLVVGVRAAVLGGVDSALAYASIAVDLVAEIAAQLVFVVLGTGLLWGRLSRAALAADPLIFAVFAGLVLMVVGATTFIAVQRKGLVGLDRLIVRWLPKAASHIQGVHEAIAAIYKHPGRIAVSIALHVAAWFSTSVGSWIALHFMGVRLPLLSVLAVESLVSAMKSAAFVVPNAAGVQEGGFAVVGVMFGMTPETAIALSLLRRARDIALGVPTLLAWQVIEGRRLLRPKAATAASALKYRT